MRANGLTGGDHIPGRINTIERKFIALLIGCADNVLHPLLRTRACYNGSHQEDNQTTAMHKLPHLATAMTPFPYSIDKNAPLRDAIALMEEHDVRHLPVTDDATLVGLIAERDIAPPNRGQSKNIDELKVSDIYVDNPYVVSLDEPLDRVLLTMADRHIGSAIVTRGGRLAGMFTCVDACRSYGRFLQDNFPHPPGNQAA